MSARFCIEKCDNKELFILAEQGTIIQCFKKYKVNRIKREREKN